MLVRNKGSEAVRCLRAPSAQTGSGWVTEVTANAGLRMGDLSLNREECRGKVFPRDRTARAKA